MKAITVLQPYAWLIAAGLKTIENRNWATKYRGQLLIHAGIKLHSTPISEIEGRFGLKIPRGQMILGGIIGRVELEDVVTNSTSPLFDGPYGFVLTEPRFVPFTPCRGLPGLFNAPGFC